MSQILINHTPADRLVSENLSRSLEKRGWSVKCSWQFPIAHRVDEFLETILPTVGCIVTFWTKSALSLHSLKDLAYEAERLNVSVPVLLETIKMPLAFRAADPLDLRSYDLDHPDNTGINMLVDKIEEVLVIGGNLASADEQPSLSVRVARRVIEELRSQEALETDQPVAPNEFALGHWQVDVGANLLKNENAEKRLAPRSMEVLGYLVARSPETVPVQEILRDVWRGRIVVDSVVHKCIRELRIALEDDYRQPEYIETYPKRGYRIIAKVG